MITRRQPTRCRALLLLSLTLAYSIPVIVSFSVVDMYSPTPYYFSTQRTSAPPSPLLSGLQTRRHALTQLYLVTEDDVLTAVNRAEELWALALDARETANAMSDRAEEEAEAAMQQSQDVATLYRNMKSISLEKIAQADAATASSMDANSMVGRALKACQKAEELEQEAEEALALSEEKLTQHLLDFPESSLAE